MNNSITINGLTLTGDVDGIAEAYQRVCDAIDQGDPVTINLAHIGTASTTIHAFRVNAVMEYPQPVPIPAEHSIAVRVQ